VNIEDFAARLDNVRGTSARCPAHDDRVNSLSFATGEHGNLIVFCHRGCSLDEIVQALGLTTADLSGIPHLVAEYPYYDLDDQLLYVVERWHPKTFRCRPGLPEPSRRVLYNLKAVQWARDNGAMLFVVEGEKDCDLLAGHGIPATCNPGGAGRGKWLPHYAELVAGCHITVVADNDSVGREHAREVAAAVKPVAASLNLAHSRIGKDLGDALDAGYDLSALEPLSDYEDVSCYVASSVPTRKVRWAWRSYMPMGKLILVEGDPGDGKSILTIDLAARFSTGLTMPDGSNGSGPWPVVMVSAEDDLDDTIVPRLEAAGADLNRIHLIPHGVTPDVPFSFGDGLPAVYNLVMRTGAKIIVFDPLMALLDSDVDSHNDHSVRRALQPLKLLASRTGASVIVVRHLNKGGAGTKAIYRGGGSIGFTGAARATFLVTTKHDEPDVRVFTCVKNNLAAKPPSLTYTVEVTGQGVPYIRWGEAVELTAQQALDGPRNRDDTPAADEYRSRKKQRIMAGEFLLDVVGDGPKTWAEIVEIGKGDGFTKMTLERARAEVGLRKITGSGGQRSTTWGLPAVPLLSHSVISSPLAGISTLPANSDEMTKWGPETTDDERRQDLRVRPLVCDVCHGTVDVTRWMKPHWVIRCELHNPEVYGGDK